MLFSFLLLTSTRNFCNEKNNSVVFFICWFFLIFCLFGCALYYFPNYFLLGQFWIVINFLNYWFSWVFTIILKMMINFFLHMCWHRLVPLMSRLWWMLANLLNVKWKDLRYVRRKLKQRHFLKKDWANNLKL